MMKTCWISTGPSTEWNFGLKIINLENVFFLCVKYHFFNFDGLWRMNLCENFIYFFFLMRKREAVFHIHASVYINNYFIKLFLRIYSFFHSVVFNFLFYSLCLTFTVWILCVIVVAVRKKENKKKKIMTDKIMVLDELLCIYLWMFL